ncbi:MAG: Chitinase [Polaromonas sp.]|jgi:chitodextrinase|nr:Chitinase [Polaromonas sp.]
MNLSRPKTNLIRSAIAGALALCLGQAASAVEVAPYFHSWGTSLSDAKRNAGMSSAIFSFAVTRGSCVLEPGFMSKLPEARAYVASGGRLLLSFGGADGVFAEIACKDDNKLFAMIENVMQQAGTRRLDFDIEGHQLLNSEANARRARVLARLQAKYPDIYISFSLPGWLHGFSGETMKLLNTTIAAGVQLDMINVMAQSFGANNIRTMVVPATVGQATVMTFRAAANQMSTLFRNKTPAQLHAMMGVTPMVGKNDDGTTFTLADAQTVANFAQANNLGMISYWSFHRDRAQAYAGNTNLGSYSGVAQSDFQYHRIFKSAGGYVPPVSAPLPPVASPTPTPPVAGGSCTAPTWVEGKYYASGSTVTYAGRQYRADVANPGYNPVKSPYFWSNYYCSGGAAPAPAPTKVSCTQPNWVEGRQYAAGNIVRYTNGRLYVATSANPGYKPTVSTYFWNPQAC